MYRPSKPALVILSAILLTGCVSTRTVPVAVTCPQPPEPPEWMMEPPEGAGTMEAMRELIDSLLELQLSRRPVSVMRPD